ncbi:DUF6007 family protein [Bacillus licheniformis]|uniref:DUF6007 family protein n=1 Tax=Bacillus licheniformis TaxID=1402 RepID=UPI000929901F|nr:hypothetical protein BFP46_22865 [Bacillus licheniformis]
MNKQKDGLYEVFKHMSIMELVFFIPVSFLFFYLPVNNIMSIILNLFIVILTGIGLATVYNFVRKQISQKKKH